MAAMTISTGKGEGATSVEVALPEPTTFADPQWAAWNMDEATVCAKAVRQVRVDIANGGGRDLLRGEVRKGTKGAALVAAVQAFVDQWTAGAQGGTRAKVMDARDAKLTKQQIAHFEAQGFKVLV